jgi:hypothetical protein
MTGQSSRSDLPQADARARFRENGSGQWTVLYDQLEEGSRRRTGLFCALAPISRRQEILDSSSWDLSIGDGHPGSMRSYGDGEITTTYLRYGSDDGIEPLVVRRDFGGIRPPYNELLEEFRHLHNLFDAGQGRMLRIGADGTEIVAAEVTPDRVRVLTRLLRGFQAARQIDLVLFVDSTHYATDDESADDTDEEEREEYLRASFYIRRLDGRPFSRYLGKRIVPAPAHSDAAMTPFDREDEYRPEFITGADDNGEPTRYSCDEGLLSNYFGGNPGAPHYLTPIFFSRDVLQKYYERPERYSVEDGYLRCRGLWGLRMDNDHPEHVMVFLGDLGRDLPSASERDYWRSFNILPPTPQMSETAFRRSFLGQFAGPKSPDLLFRFQYESFAARWRDKFGWPLYRPAEPGDEHLLQNVRVPLTESDPEFEEQLLNLARLLIDFLNDSELKKRIKTTTDDLKSIGKLDAWLGQDGYPHKERDIGLLRALQSLRSKGAAHRKGSNYASELTALVGEATRQEAIRGLLQRALELLEGLSNHFELVD